MLMKISYLKFAAFGLALATSASMLAIDPPAIPTQELADGGKYVLINKEKYNSALYRTSWDGALVLGSFSGCGHAPAGAVYQDYEMEASKNDDGTWEFSITTPAAVEGEDDFKGYLYLPSGSGNLNLGENPASWKVEPGKEAGFYYLTPGEGNNPSAEGYYVHLNAGKEYVVISYLNAPWYPDYDQKQEQDSEGSWYPIEDERGAVIHADSTDFNWAFVKVTDLPAYIGKASGYAVIRPYEEDYVGTDGYEAGFQAGYDAVMEIYNDPTYTADDVLAIEEIIKAKVALYNEILKAEDLNTTEDEVLAGAVANAKAIFDSSVNPTDLANALYALVEAESVYSQGGGDFTSLGKNMSFEDLSAQNGNTTSGIANPPYGWNLILNGDTVKTATEVQEHGFNAWCGVNADCTGAKDGNYGFGIWNSSIPSTEISQTITGLENGTYTVSAALMVGANGGGSRRTTQRIFGNLNSTYFASSFDYDHDKLDNSEVYGFADLVEPITDVELQPISVRAYVYDGTLTFGLRTDGNIAAANRVSSNPQGGDGWFKLDNFRIIKEGYFAEDALAILAHYVDILADWHDMDVPMALATEELLATNIVKLRNVGSENTSEEIDAAILDAKALLLEVNASVKAYEKLYDVIAEHYDYLDVYQAMPGAEAYSEVISEVENGYYDGVYSVEGIEEAIAMLDAALEACKKSEILVGKDITYIINNPSFENMSTQPGGDSSGIEDAPKGWNVILDGDTCKVKLDISKHGVANWCAINSGDPINVELEDGTIVTQQPTEGSKLWGIWTANIPDVELSQVLVGLPAGTYTMTADVMVQHNWAGNNMTTQRIFANSYIQMFGSEEAHAINLPQDAQGAAARDAANPDADIKFLTYAGYTCESGDPTTDLLKTMTVTFGVDETGVAKIGFRTNNVNLDGVSRDEGGIDGQGWFKVDNFTLFYDSEAIPTGIGSINADGAATAISERQFFTVGGVQVAAPVKGINIVKNVMSDGTVKVTKTVVK